MTQTLLRTWLWSQLGATFPGTCMSNWLNLYMTDFSTNLCKWQPNVCSEQVVFSRVVAAVARDRCWGHTCATEPRLPPPATGHTPLLPGDLGFEVLPCCFHHVDHVHGSVSHGSAHTGELGRLVLSPQGVFEPCFCSCWLLHLVLFPSLGQAVPESVAEVPLATLVTVSGAAGGISLSVPSKELHFINHFSFATFTLFSLSGASLVPILFFQATRNGIEMWEIFSCLMNCASEASFCSWITILSFPLHCQAFPARDSCVPAFFSSPTLSLHHCSFAPCSTT